MRAYLALCLLAAVLRAVHADCDVCLDGQCYKKHSLSAFDRWFTCLGINRHANTIYLYDASFIKKCNLATLTCNDTAEMGYFRSIMVGYKTNDIYGTVDTNELYKLDLENSSKDLLVRGNVWDTALKDKLYYSQGYLGRGLLVFENGESRVVPGTESYEIYSFAISNEGDVYFDNNSRILKLSKGVVTEATATDGYKITVDKDGDIILFQPSSLAIYRVTNGKILEVGAVTKDISLDSTPLFDRDNNLVMKDQRSKYLHVKKERNAHCTTSISQYVRVITETA